MPTTSDQAALGGNDQNDPSAAKVSPADQKLLEQIRTRYRYMVKRWKNIRDQAEGDMKALYSKNGPWDDNEVLARQAAKRPMLHQDQLKQYPNTLVNQVRQNPQAPKVTPAGNGANDKTATLRGDRIRAIRTECNAVQAELTALQCAAERGYGVLTLEVEEIEWDGFDQRMKIVREPDPDAVLWDPDAKEADSSDMQDAFKCWQMPIADFKRDWPEAQVVDCNLDEQTIAGPEWINVERQTVQVARYSYIQKKRRYVYLVADGSPKGKKIFKDELAEGVKEVGGWLTLDGQRVARIVKEKVAIEKSVKQCITNGVEILDRADWAGKWIPVFPLLGNEAYLRDKGEVERILESYIHPAIPSQQGFNSAKTNQVETANMVPKSTYLGYEGQFSTSTDWKNINKIATPYAEIVASPEGAQGQILPLPVRTDWNPQIEGMELMAESNRRSIQAAIGSHGFTIQDDTNVKSGKAVNALKSQSDVGSYHFVDNYHTMLRHLGRAMNDLLDKIEDTDREVGIDKEDGSHEVIRINAPYQDKRGDTVEHRYTPRNPQTQEPQTDAAHDVVLTTGPDYASQREEAKDFVKGLLQLPQAALILDLLVNWMDLGHDGDAIAERLTPPQFAKKEGEEEIPPQVKQQLGQLTQQNQELTEAVNALLEEQKAKKAELDSKERIAQAANALKKYEIQSNERIAKVNAQLKVGMFAEQLSSDEEVRASEMEFEQQNMQLGHNQAMEEQQQAAEQQSMQAEQEHGQGMEQQQAGHEQTLEQQAAGADQAMQQQTQAEQAAAQQQQAAFDQAPENEAQP